MRLLCIILCWTIIPTICIAQVTELEVSKYPFISRDKNVIHNDSLLLPFFRKLKEREEKQNSRVVVGHVGDSHIQADFFSGRIREELQKRFGNAGRGLVFPYRAARSNEPYSIKSKGTGKWKSGRNVVNRDSLPIGISGFALQSSDTAGLIFLKTSDAGELDYSFKVVEVFCENDSGYCKPDLRDTSSLITLRSISSELHKETFVLNEKSRAIAIGPSEKDTLKPLRLYGINLMNEDSGLLYHTIGVNGAEFRHYNRSTYFFSQFFRLKPDLVIVSLGTNEAYGKGFEAGDFIRNVKTFTDTIKAVLPDAVILFTIPSDSYRGRYRNRTVELVRDLIISYCNTNSYAYWDLFEVMGGPGSMAKWYAKGLSAKDKLHFRPKGYAIQGFLFNEALMKSYNEFSGAKQQ